MSGKRILDAVALLSAGRNVAAKHFEIRLSQVDLYSKTSSIGKGLRSRSERVAPTLFASTQSFSNSAHRAAGRPQDTSIPAQENVADPNPDASKDGEPMSDHHYERSTENTVMDPVPQQELDIEQEQAKKVPLPDGTIPPSDSPVGTRSASSHRHMTSEPVSATTGLSSDEAKILQRQSEFQIPAQPAEPPESSEFGVEQEQDVFYQPPGTTSPVLSALPRIRVPKVEWDVQGGDPHIPGNINPDVYYSGREPASIASEEPTEEMLSQLFHSSKVSRMLGNKSKSNAGGARAFHTVSHRQKPSDKETETAETVKLAAELAKDVHVSDAVSHS